MRPALRIALGTGALVATGLWTLLALGSWWLLQTGAAALEAQPAAASLQALTAWTERPWARLWLDPQEAEALRDGVHWLLGLGGGPAHWLSAALAWLGVALVLLWAGGLLLGALLLLGTWQLARWARARWQPAAGGPWAYRRGAEPL
jgi:hypothetical protein